VSCIESFGKKEYSYDSHKNPKFQILNSSIFGNQDNLPNVSIRIHKVFVVHYYFLKMRIKNVALWMLIASAQLGPSTVASLILTIMQNIPWGCWQSNKTVDSKPLHFLHQSLLSIKLLSCFQSQYYRHLNEVQYY